MSDQSGLKLPVGSRRSFLAKMMAVPFVTSGMAGGLLAGCGSASNPIQPETPSTGGTPAPGTTPAATFQSATFVAMAAPSLADAAQITATSVRSKLNVVRSDKTTTTFDLGYAPFFTTGDSVAGNDGNKVLAGGYYNINNQPIMDNSVAGQSVQFFSSCPDGTSLLSVANPTVKGIKGKAVFAVVQFEYSHRNLAGSNSLTVSEGSANDMYGKLPSPVAVLTLDQDQTTGKLTLVKYANVDTSGVNGLWITCGSSLSPWGTHLSSEEYEPDAFKLPSYFSDFSQNLYGNSTSANPYHYGHMPEVTVNPDGTGSIKKHYCLGRISHELIQMMPDNRTALMGDDATNSGLFMFIADREKDLSAGTLYVAKLGTGFSVEPGTAGCDLQWIKLGYATSAEIRAMVDGGIKNTDIMDVKTTDPLDSSYTKVFVSGAANWIKVNANREKAAAFLETHRYAYLKGGSLGFTKMEGTTLNIKDKKAYSALQNVQDSMIVNGKGWDARNNISVPKTLKAGCVLEHTLGGGQKDTDGNAINSDWVPLHTKALIKGTDITADALGNTADPNTIGNPDNLKFSEKLRTLFIGEDSGQHFNNFIWAYNVDTGALARIASMPFGAEATGLGVIDDLNGWTYITANFQHPGDWSKWGSGIDAATQSALTSQLKANYKDGYGASVGYITAVPTQIKLNG